MMYSDLKAELCNTWLKLNAEQMAQIRLALLELSTSAVEIPRMRDINRCGDLSSALRLLEKWKLLTPTKVDVLMLLTKQVGLHTEMVRERLQEYKKLNLPSHPMPSRPTHTTGEERSRSSSINQTYFNICEYLSTNLRDRWIDLGRALGQADFISELQRTSSIRQKDKIYQTLEEHAKQTGNNAIPLLLNALENCRLKRQSDHISRTILPQ